jgi:nucleotide-binding universal stress UspA family protein
MPAAPLPEVREILFATDFSPSSDAAARVAAAYARGLGARLHILHVAASKAGAAPSLLSPAADWLGADVPVRTAVRRGVPAAQIVRYARRAGIDLIVVGSHGRTGVTRALLGSVAERVARTAPCPVLTVPAGFRADAQRAPKETSPPEPERRRCLVCASASEDLICEACRARIRGEAVERKWREQKTGKP